MDTFRIHCIVTITCFLLLTASEVLCQDVLTPKGSKVQASSSLMKAVPIYYSQHKKLSSSFSGYMIELIQSDIPLSKSYPLFKNFGNIYYHKLDDGKYSYCIEVDFYLRSEMKKFVANVIRKNAPEAKLVQYKIGKRKVFKR